MPRNSKRLFLLSASARAYTQAAMRRQRPVVAIDGFLDADLDADEAIRANLEDGQFSAEILEIVCQRSQPDDLLVYGSGFESNPDLLEHLQSCVRVLGNSPGTICLCADPMQLSIRLKELGISGPETKTQQPKNPEGWLVKQKGRAGGCHVQPASRFQDPSDSSYWQRQCTGSPHSALFLAGGGIAHVIGISQLLPSGRTDAPYAWSGAIGPVRVLPEVFEQVQWAAQVLASDLDLLGLCGIDFIVDPKKEVQLVDLNPRLVATCELYADCFASDYMSAHIETCLTGNPDGHLIPASERREGVRGMQVVYAPCPIAGMANWKWPDGAADLPKAGTSIDAGQPLCTVRGHYRDADEARASLQDLSHQALACLQPDTLHSFSPGSPAHEVAH